MLSIDVLKKSSLFSGLLPATLQSICDSSSIKQYPQGATVLLEGDPAKAAYFVLVGEVKIYRMTVEGREQVLARMGCGQSFNTVPLFHVNPIQHSSVEAVLESILLSIPQKKFLWLLQTCPDFGFIMLQDFATRLEKLTDMVENFALHSVRGRLAGFLLTQADLGNQARRFTQDEIAREIGTVRDVVGRLLKSFVDDGLIRRDGRRIVLLDQVRLETEAKL